MKQCKHEMTKASKVVKCGMIANEASGYCPRHEALIPALEAEAERKAKLALQKKKEALRRGARR